jgi:hypothetical protein
VLLLESRISGDNIPISQLINGTGPFNHECRTYYLNSRAFNVRSLCRVLEVSPSGYYAWCLRGRGPSRRQRRQADTDHQVAQAFHRRKGRAGAPRLVLDLHDAGLPINRKTVAASLRRQGLRAKAARKFKATTNSRHSLPVAPNLLQQNFTATDAQQKGADPRIRLEARVRLATWS